MDKNKKITIIISFVVVAALFFYGGMKYSQSQTKSKMSAFGANGAASFGAGRTRGGAGGAGGAISGQVLSQDAQSITLKLRTGGSQVIFFASSTEIQKSTAGSLADITNGSNIMVIGQTNSDGSVTANTIELRPAMPNNIATGTAPMNQ